MFDLKIKEGRLLETIHETAKWGAKGTWGPESTQTGVCRLALSDLDKEVRNWFVAEVENLGCKVKIDTMGNIFAIYPGRNPGNPTGIGSHLDTQPNGGRYDGILGVLAGLEVLRTLKENKYVPNYPIALIDWTNEEGARFPRAIVSSSVWAGLISEQEAHAIQSIDDLPVTIEAELKRIGYNGTVETSYRKNSLAAHFELHIEQGPVLENENKKIGVVLGVQAFSWNKVTVRGNSSHAGTTPMNTRADALEAASKMIIKGIEIAEKHNGLATIGTISVGPALINVIPDTVHFSFDARHAHDELVATIVEESKKEFENIANSRKNKMLSKPLTVEWKHIHTSPAVKFNETNVLVVRGAALELFEQEEVKEIISGAGHDSCSTSAVVPTSMIFIPSKNGVSHNPEEYSSPEEVENGFKVLLNTILKYDELRKEKAV